MSYHIAANGFEDKRSIYKESVDKDKNVHIDGICFFHSIAFKFSLNEQSGKKKEGPLMRGRISIISPADGQILQATGSINRSIRRRLSKEDVALLSEGNRLEKFNCTAAIYINSLDEKRIKQCITSKILKLYSKHEATIRAAQKELGLGANHTAAEATNLYLKDFEKKNYFECSKKTRSSMRNEVIHVTSFFDTVPMGEVTQTMIKAYAKERGENADIDLRYAQRFWTYCREKGVYAGENPLDIYWGNKSMAKRHKIDPAIDIRQAFELKCLPTDVEKNLNHIILDNQNSGPYLGLLLATEGLPAKIICGIKWKDIIFKSDVAYTSIIIKKECLTGATHDFTRPLSPFVAGIIKERHLSLLEDYTENDLHEFYVVALNDQYDKPLESKNITSLCRTALIHAGIDGYVLAAIPGINHGAGIRLLGRNAKYRYEYFCGLSADPAAVSFLLGHSLQDDVTADHYRSFTCPEGQLHLYKALKRDTHFLDMSIADDAVPVTKKPLIDGRTEYGISPMAPNKLTCAKIQVKPGSHIYLSSLQGISCSIVVKKISTKQALNKDSNYQG